MNGVKERIRLNMSGMQVIMAVAGGNPGAINVCLNLMKNAVRIDPKAWAKELQPLLSLDSLEIWESDILCLYKDVCHQSIDNMFIIFRAYQYGIIRQVEIRLAIDSQGQRTFDFVDLLRSIKGHLPEFNAVAV